MAATFVVGIDLGTTNTVLAAAAKDGGDIDAFPIPQTVAPGEVAAFDRLPSALYLAGKGEFEAGAASLPWGEEKSPPTFVGAFAATQGAKVPGRLVASAKSWLCHAAVDRSAAILPWGAADDVVKISPVQASAQILEHVRSAWDAAHPDAPLAEQEVVLTVPASFDEVARGLTLQAAKSMGLEGLRLLEEPQAAFYDFVRAHEDGLADALKGVRLALIVDVGGGTTDLTLVQVTHQSGAAPKLERVAVSDHIMLGGDNMDAAIARHVENALTGTMGGLEAARWGALVQASRLAKEALTQQDAPDSVGVPLVSRGSKLIGGTKTHALEKEKARELVLEGFWPVTAHDEVPQKRTRLALSEFSLPYADDPAIPKHICAFLRRHVEAAARSGAKVENGLPQPDAVLLNGGVFNAPAIVAQLQSVFAHWYGAELPILDHKSLDLSVARGAVYSAFARRGKGAAIEGGSARAYYVGVENADGEEEALCVVPRGMREGETLDVDRTFRVRVGRPISFRLMTSSGDRTERAGELISVDDDLSAMPPLQTVLEPADEVPVQLQTHLTELGTLELRLQMTPEALQAFALEFNTRGQVEDGQAKKPKGPTTPPEKLDDAKAEIALFYGGKSQDIDPRQVKNLRRRLEKILGPREEWPLPTSRELFAALHAGAKRRRRTPDHERVFFALCGYTLRPGFGFAVDDWRVDELWKLHAAGVQHVKEKPVWAAWWLMWRRVSGGLDQERQLALLEDMRWSLTPQKLRQGKAPKGPTPHGQDEMVRLAASLERLPKEAKAEIGAWFLLTLGKKAHPSWWPLGRLGARTPFAGSPADVVDKTVASEWVEHLLKLDWDEHEAADFAAASIARMTGDVDRDLEEDLRERVAKRLKIREAPEGWVTMVREVVPLSAQDEARALGDALPAGLTLAA